MISIPDNVRQDLITLLPASLLNELSCFVLNDNHPRGNQNVDITICTLRGEVKEFYKRDLVSSTIINSSWKPQNIRILRNSTSELFYLVSYEDEIALVLSSNNGLQVLHKIKNIDTYEVDDSLGRGQASLKIICKDDAVPLYFSDNFEKLGDRAEVLGKDTKDDSLPIVTQLARKLTEVKYSVKCNEKVLKNLTNLRQVAAYSDYKKCCLKDGDAVYREEEEESCGPLKIKSQIPLVKICNKKISIILEVVNTGTLLAENIHILIHTSHASTVYTTKVFENTSSPPYWKEKPSNTITPSSCYNAIVAVIDLKELKYSVTSKINLNGVISYKVESKEHLLPFKEINLSSLDTMHDTFDVLSTIEKDCLKYNLVAFLATSVKTELCLRYIKSENRTDLKLLDKFCEHLNMERIASTSNIILHKSSSYNILYGVMVIEEQLIKEDKWMISLYTRSNDQILAFIHCMYDAMPYRIVATTMDQKITSKAPELSNYNESTSKSPKNMNYTEFKSSMLKQTSLTLEYLDECMMHMNESKNQVVQSKVGSEINIYAGGLPKFEEFRNKVLKEGARGIRSICEEEPEGMVIDID